MYGKTKCCSWKSPHHQEVSEWSFLLTECSHQGFAHMVCPQGLELSLTHAAIIISSHIACGSLEMPAWRKSRNYYRSQPRQLENSQARPWLEPTLLTTCLLPTSLVVPSLWCFWQSWPFLVLFFSRQLCKEAYTLQTINAMNFTRELWALKEGIFSS